MRRLKSEKTLLLHSMLYEFDWDPVDTRPANRAKVITVSGDGRKPLDLGTAICSNDSYHDLRTEKRTSNRGLVALSRPLLPDPLPQPQIELFSESTATMHCSVTICIDSCT